MDDNAYYDANDYILTLRGDDDLKRTKEYLSSIREYVEYAVFTPLISIYGKTDLQCHGYVLFKPHTDEIEMERELGLKLRRASSKVERAVIRYDVDTKRQWQSKIINCIISHSKSESWLVIGQYPFDLIDVPVGDCNHVVRKGSCLRCKPIINFDLFFDPGDDRVCNYTYNTRYGHNQLGQRTAANEKARGLYRSRVRERLQRKMMRKQQTLNKNAE